MASSANPALRVVFVVNHVAFFVSHRLPVALAAQARGWTVALVTGQPGSAVMEVAAEAPLRDSGIRHFRTRFTASGMNPLTEGLGALQTLWHLLRLRPSVVHCASPKGVLIGGIAARLLRVRRVVLAISGMGFAFTEGASPSMSRRIAAAIIRLLGGVALRNPRARVVVQNHDDAREIGVMLGGAEDRLVIVPGSGVDLAATHAVPMSEKSRMVLLPGRVVRDKGVGEFAAAAAVLRQRHPDWRFCVAGSADYANPSAFPPSQMDAWAREGHVEFLGHVEDIAPLMAAASIVCLPSYREGMPKALLEAAAWGCAVVTTDVPGCREAVLPDETGVLVPARDAAALTDALSSLIGDFDRRRRFGIAGRALAERQFGLDSVVQRLLALYA